jgi:hypothetical protein
MKILNFHLEVSGSKSKKNHGMKFRDEICSTNSLENIIKDLDML